jgi:hypothetical protein
VPVHDRRYAGEVLIGDLVARPPQFVDNFGNPQRVPHKHRIREQAEAACLVHDFFRISGSKLAPIGEKQTAPREFVTGITPVQLQLDTVAQFRIEGADDYCPLGEVPIEWAGKRIMGPAATEKEYADVCSSDWISRLRKLLAVHLKTFGLDEFDASVLQQTAPRILTQFVSRIVFNGGFAGIYYRSKYGHDIENWALFEPIRVLEPELIRPDDRDLQRALELHSLKFKE